MTTEYYNECICRDRPKEKCDMDHDADYQTYYNKGFTLIELLAVIVILGILTSIAVLSVSGIIERTEKEVCEANRLELGRNYRVHLIVENKVHTNTSFNEFLLKYDGEICPVGGEISYDDGKVKCSVHSIGDEDRDEGNDDEVPYL